jgi:hypothetical protein
MERISHVPKLRNFLGGLKWQAKVILEELSKANAIAPSDEWVRGTDISGSVYSNRYQGYNVAFRGLLEAEVIERTKAESGGYKYRITNQELANELLTESR